jgi:hypothetical protein
MGTFNFRPFVDHSHGILLISNSRNVNWKFFGPVAVYRPSTTQPLGLIMGKDWTGFSSTMYTSRHTYLQCVPTFLGGTKTPSCTNDFLFRHIPLLNITIWAIPKMSWKLFGQRWWCMMKLWLWKTRHSFGLWWPNLWTSIHKWLRNRWPLNNIWYSLPVLLQIIYLFSSLLSRS